VAAIIALALAGVGAALAWEGYQDARGEELEEVADGARAGAADVSQPRRPPSTRTPTAAAPR